MDWQVSRLAADPAFQDPSDDLVIVWGGANDFLDDVTADPTDSVNSLVAIITELIGLGADSLLLAHVPPLDQTPEFDGSPVEALAAAFSISLDGLYRTAVADLELVDPQVDLLYFDVYAAMQDAITDPAAFGFTNVDDSLLLAAGPISNPDGYLFWDGVHPTRAGHAELARIAAGLVPAPPVLLLPGIAALLAGRIRGFGRGGTGRRRL